MFFNISVCINELFLSWIFWVSASWVRRQTHTNVSLTYALVLLISGSWKGGIFSPQFSIPFSRLLLLVNYRKLKTKLLLFSLELDSPDWLFWLQLYSKSSVQITLLRTAVWKYLYLGLCLASPSLTAMLSVQFSCLLLFVFVFTAGENKFVFMKRWSLSIC